MTPALTVEALAPIHNRKSFQGGRNPPSATWPRSRSSKSGAASATASSPSMRGRIVGYDTLAAASTSLTKLTADETRTLPRYPLLPVCLVGRLAIAVDRQGRISAP